MKATLILVASFCFAACGWASTTKQQTTPSSTQSAATGEPSYEVRVMRNGLELAAYNHTGPRAVGLFDSQSFELFLASNDNQNVLMVGIQGVNVGRYALPADKGAAKPGEARLEFINNKETLVLIPDKGELRLETSSGKHCSGSFTGTGTDLKGLPFTIEGKFSNLTIKDVAER